MFGWFNLLNQQEPWAPRLQTLMVQRQSEVWPGGPQPAGIDVWEIHREHGKVGMAKILSNGAKHVTLW